ncbi:MAG TPA: putative aminohydrolase SsnA [Symbiobacteriaceae bacterium]|jgi:putative selenium metabolism protein SsnA
MTLLIGPGPLVTMSAGEVVPDGGILVDGDKIARVGDFATLRSQRPDAEVLDAKGGMIIPGLTNAHTHLYGLFARGFAFPGPPPRSFRQILEQVWWKLDKALTREAVRISALYGLADSLRAGVTAVCDHHASPDAIAGSLDDIAQAAASVGVRACLAYEVTDRNGPEGAAAGIAENARFSRNLTGDSMLAARFGLHAGFTVSDETLAACRRTAEDLGVGFHIHLAEGPEDQADSLLKYGKRTTHRLAAAGILRPGTFVGHGVHLTDEEIALLAESGAILTHQPHSNMGNAVGWPRILRMRERNVRVALGTDGYTPDMLESLRTAATFHSHSTQTPSAGIAEFAEVLLHDNPKILSEVFGVRLGRLEPGAAADIVVTDYRPPTPVTAENAPFHIFFGLSSAHVNTVLVAGQLKVKGHKLLSVDEEALAKEAQKVAAAVWARI